MYTTFWRSARPSRSWFVGRKREGKSFHQENPAAAGAARASSGQTGVSAAVRTGTDGVCAAARPCAASRAVGSPALRVHDKTLPLPDLRNVGRFHSGMGGRRGRRPPPEIMFQPLGTVRRDGPFPFLQIPLLISCCCLFIQNGVYSYYFSPPFEVLLQAGWMDF